MRWDGTRLPTVGLLHSFAQEGGCRILEGGEVAWAAGRMQLLNWNKATSSQLPLPPLATVPGILKPQTRPISLTLPQGVATFPSLSSFPSKAWLSTPSQKKERQTAQFSRASCYFSGEILQCLWARSTLSVFPFSPPLALPLVLSTSPPFLSL